MRRLWIAALLACTLAAPGPAVADANFGSYVTAARLLQQWRFEDAKEAIAKLIDEELATQKPGS